MQSKRLIRSATDSFTRRFQLKAEVAARTDPTPVARNVGTLTKPNSPGKTVRRVGMALLASPDIVTDVPGAALVATAYVMKRREPTNIGQLALETRKVLRDIQSLSL
jgi:hypothetical protein